jgi:hypothetical protein
MMNRIAIISCRGTLRGTASRSRHLFVRITYSTYAEGSLDRFPKEDSVAVY